MTRSNTAVKFSTPTKIGVCCTVFFAFTIWQLNLNEKSHTRDHEFREAVLTSDEAAVHRLLAQGYDATQATVDYRESNVFERLAGFVMRSENEKPALDFTIVSSYAESMKRRALSQLASRQSSGGSKNRGFYSDILSEKSYLSLQGRRMAIMNDLSEHGCKVNPSPPNNYSLLQNSSMGGCSEVIKFLLAHGAKIDANDPGAAIALNWACQSGDLETVQTLLDNGAKVGLSSFQGYTALMQTTIMGVQYPKDEKYLAILKTLIKRERMSIRRTPMVRLP